MSGSFKEGREMCWNARDKYWNCLDINNNTDKCLEFRKQYETLCSKQWVKHFDNKRKYEKFKADIDKVGWELPSQQGK